MTGPPYGIAMVAACPFPQPRGTPTRIHRLAEALVRRGHRVHVVTYHLGDDTAIEADGLLHVHRIPNVPTYRKLSPGPSYQKLLVLDGLLALKLARVLRAHRIDVIHAHHVEGLLVALVAASRRRQRCPIVFDAHTLLESELPFYRVWPPAAAKRRLGRLLDRHLPRRADHTIAVAPEIRARLLALGAATADRVSVISNGAEVELFDVPPRVASLAERPGVRTTVFTGNLATYQGIELMLKAFALLRAGRRDVRLLVVSEMPFAPYEPLAEGLGVRDALDVVTGGFEVVPRCLAGADIALNPRTACPGVPQKLLNYMAAGKAIVSFAGSAKFLTHGEHGLVVEDGDVRGFARAMGRLLDDPALARRLGANARGFVDRELSWDRSAELTERVYARVLCPRAAHELRHEAPPASVADTPR